MWLIASKSCRSPLAAVFAPNDDPEIMRLKSIQIPGCRHPLCLGRSFDVMMGSEKYLRVCERPETPTFPAAGNILSYSAGSSDLSPWRYRLIQPSDRLEQVIHAFPELAQLLTGPAPVVINCYPATLGAFDSAIFIDTYSRVSNFIRGIRLAKELNAPAIVLGQPLNVLSLLLKSADVINARVPHLVFGLGGYACPDSLAAALRHEGHKIAHGIKIVYAYGTAETDFGILIGLSRDSNGDVLYKGVIDEWSPVVKDEALRLVNKQTGAIVDSGDEAYQCGEFFVIRNRESRLHRTIWDDLSRWSVEDWLRRTGYLHYSKDELLFQLRERQSSQRPDEMDFYRFCKEYGMSYSDKPKWNQN